MRSGGFGIITHMRWTYPLGLLSLVAACGGDPAPAPETSDMTQPVCDDPDEICLKKPASGFQINSDRVTIAAGQDVEYCEIVEVPGQPGETFYVKAFESQMTAGSHHLIVNALEMGGPDDAKFETGERFECFAAVGFTETIPLTGSQKPYQLQPFPEGVGKIVHAGQKIVLNYHYFNTAAEQIHAETAVNFHLADPAEIQKEAQQFGMVNIGIEVPPMANASFTEECTFYQDIMVYGLTRHTHRWGTDFKAWFVGGERDGELALESDHYENVNFPFDEPLLMKTGTGFRFQCDYENTEQHALTFGEKATDEMCILFGGWYTVNEGDIANRQGCIRN